MEKVIAKFVCTTVQDNPEAESKSVSFSPVIGGSDENKSFSKYTPAGNLNMIISYETPAAIFFKEGKEYFLEFTEAN